MRAVILGGTGAIGAATALRLLRAGWAVEVTGRDGRSMPPQLTKLGARFSAVDSADHAAIRRLIGAGAELFLDTTAFTAASVLGLEPALRDVGSAVLISGRAVYTDAADLERPTAAQIVTRIAQVMEWQGELLLEEEVRWVLSRRTPSPR